MKKIFLQVFRFPQHILIVQIVGGQQHQLIGVNGYAVQLIILDGQGLCCMDGIPIGPMVDNDIRPHQQDTLRCAEDGIGIPSVNQRRADSLRRHHLLQLLEQIVGENGRIIHQRAVDYLILCAVRHADIQAGLQAFRHINIMIILNHADTLFLLPWMMASL